MSTLTIHGTLDVAQFWPRGNSDADTAKVSLAGVTNPFRFKPDGAKEIVTRAFATATVRSAQGTTAVVKNGTIDVRLQGIDAPELHYQPQRFRQPFGESAAAALGALLATGGQPALPCRVVTRVAAPNEVCDLFGRVVGEIIVRLGQRSVNLNAWVAKEGWAFPAFYTSMTADEIARYTRLTEAARKAKKHLWQAGAYTPQIGPFDAALREHKPGSAPAPDAGPVIWPKYFRRLVEWKLDAKSAAPTLKAWLAGRATERFVPAGDFAAQGAAAKPRSLADGLDAADRMTLEPRDFVVVEKPSTLYAADGKTKIIAW
jgi:endonuclease YncB( thermonuclease family)